VTVVASLESQMREWIVRYLAREVALQDLEAWLVPASWDIDEEDDPGSAEVAYTAQLLLAERAHDHLSQTALDEHLRQLVSKGRLGVSSQQVTASSASTQQAPWTLQVAGVGKRSEVAPA
jgi:hypothetical protein